MSGPSFHIWKMEHLGAPSTSGFFNKYLLNNELPYAHLFLIVFKITSYDSYILQGGN